MVGVRQVYMVNRDSIIHSSDNVSRHRRVSADKVSLRASRPSHSLYPSIWMALQNSMFQTKSASTEDGTVIQQNSTSKNKSA